MDIGCLRWHATERYWLQIVAHGLGQANYIPPFEVPSPAMPTENSRRLRWARCFAILAAACSLVYGYQQLSNFFVAEVENAEPVVEVVLDELGPTVKTMDAKPSSRSKAAEKPVAASTTSTWDPQPQWRYELQGSMGQQARKASEETLLPSMVSEEFPLEPRFRKGPPIIGDAVTTYGYPPRFSAPQMIAQPQPSIPMASFDAQNPWPDSNFHPKDPTQNASQLVKSNGNFPGSLEAGTASRFNALRPVATTSLQSQPSSMSHPNNSSAVRPHVEPAATSPRSAPQYIIQPSKPKS
jgi:hypothetical protein